MRAYLPRSVVSQALGDELECRPRSPSADQRAEREFLRRVALQQSSRPPHERQQEDGRKAPGPEHVYQAHRRAGDARGVKREVDEGRKEREGQRRERVSEEGSPQLRGRAEEGDDDERPGVQRRDDPQWAHPLGPRDAPRVANLARAGEVEEIEERETARKREAQDPPQQAARPSGFSPDREEE